MIAWEQYNKVPNDPNLWVARCNKVPGSNDFLVEARVKHNDYHKCSYVVWMDAASVRLGRKKQKGSNMETVVV